jgi:glucokinase
MNTIGIDVGGTNIKAVLISPTGEILRRASLPTEAQRGRDVVIGIIHRGIELLVGDVATGDLGGIGIGVPGSIDFDHGTVLHPPNLPGWDEVPLVALMEERWKVPVLLDNDANCAALGEANFGAGQEVSHFIGITLGTGVGSGIIINREIYHGARGYAGEFGHASIDYNGPLCACGNRGCIEAYVGNSYLIANAKQRLAAHPESVLYAMATDDATLTPKDISDASAAGDPVATRILYDVGCTLGIAISNAANLMDIPTFIIGGGVSAAGKPLFDGIRETANTRVLKVHRGGIAILPAALGNDAGVMGAASLLA